MSPKKKKAPAAQKLIDSLLDDKTPDVTKSDVELRNEGQSDRFKNGVDQFYVNLEEAEKVSDELRDAENSFPILELDENDLEHGLVMEGSRPEISKRAISPAYAPPSQSASSKAGTPPSPKRKATPPPLPEESTRSKSFTRPQFDELVIHQIPDENDDSEKTNIVSSTSTSTGTAVHPQTPTQTKSEVPAQTVSRVQEESYEPDHSVEAVFPAIDDPAEYLRERTLTRTRGTPETGIHDSPVTPHVPDDGHANEDEPAPYQQPEPNFDYPQTMSAIHTSFKPSESAADEESEPVEPTVAPVHQFEQTSTGVQFNSTDSHDSNSEPDVESTHEPTRVMPRGKATPPAYTSDQSSSGVGADSEGTATNTLRIDDYTARRKLREAQARKSVAVDSDDEATQQQTGSEVVALGRVSNASFNDSHFDRMMPTEVKTSVRSSQDRANLHVASTPPKANPAAQGGFAFSSAEASLKQSESLRIAQARISELEQELGRLRRENEQLASAGETLRRRTDELLSKSENIEIQARESQRIFDEEKKVFRGQLHQKEREIQDLRSRNEEMEGRLDSNFKKIRVRERELEHRLEIIKMESATLVSTKDKMILDLKRQIDQLTHENEYSKQKTQELFNQYKGKQDTIRRVVRALRIALTVLEGDEDVAPLKKVD